MATKPTTSALEINSMEMVDLPTVMEIERICHVEPWREQFFLEEMSKAHSRILVARDCADGGKVMGYICYWLVADEIQIFNVAVHLARRRLGIGRSLLLEALRRGYGARARVALLEVRRSNDSARKLYENLGFKPAGIRPDYYDGIREPAILMELEMNREWKSRWLDGKDAVSNGRR